MPSPDLLPTSGEVLREGTPNAGELLTDDHRVSSSKRLLHPFRAELVAVSW